MKILRAALTVPRHAVRYRAARRPNSALLQQHENLPWLSLVGAIANGGGGQAHETFLSGQGCTYTPQNSGYCYAYAKDTWNCNGNNRRRVSLEIS